MPKGINAGDNSLVYYGPHPCQKCDRDGKLGTMIVKAGNGAPDALEFNFTHGSHYPNHEWRRHICDGKSIRAMAMGSASTPKKSKSSARNGKLGGRPKKVTPIIN